MRCVAVVAALILSSPLQANAAPAGGWTPCAGCVVRIPAEPSERPRPLLVVLHGDGAALHKALRAWQAACDQAGVLLLAPLCPRELGCASGSFWQWLAGPRHDSAWLGAQLDAVAARHAVDPARVYATGYSGGATYLGWYAPRFPTRFAAVSFVSGGARYGEPCPACKVPVRFDIGAVDPMVKPYTEPLHQFFDACRGHEVMWNVLPSVTHEGMLDLLAAGRAREILSWLLARPAACSTADAGVAETPPRDAGLDAAATSSSRAPPPAHVPPTAGCACGRGGSSSGAVVLAAAALTAAPARRRRAARHPRPDDSTRPAAR